MNLQARSRGLPLLLPNRRRRAFTLPELMSTVALFSILMAGVLGSHLFGLRLYRISESKLSATGAARHALNHVRDEIRSGKMLLVGNGSETTFTPIADHASHIGNALQIYPTTDTNQFVRFFLDATDDKLKRFASGDTEAAIVASYITNRLVFSAEDYQGQVLTNNQNNRVIRMVLEFYQWEFPVATAGAGGMYDYYRLNTRITRRAIE